MGDGKEVPPGDARFRTGAAFALVRAYAQTTGRVALARALPVYVGLVAGIGLLFGGHGLAAATVVAYAEQSAWWRGILWAGWLVVMTPTLAALWLGRESAWLRSLPVGRRRHLGALVGMSIAAESLWVTLWASGGGVVAGIGALGGALMGHAVVLARPGGVVGIAAVATALLWVPLWGLAIGTWPIALVAFRTAWLRAPTRTERSGRWIAGRPVVALAWALLVSVRRGQGAVLVRAGLVVALATGAAWAAGQTNAVRELGELGSFLCGFLAPAVIVAGSAVSGPMLAIEQAGAWLLKTRTSRRTRRGAMALGLLAVGVVLGTGAGGVLVLATLAGDGVARDGWSAGVLVLLGALSGGSLAVVAGLLARWAGQFGARGPGRLVVALLLEGIVALGLLVRLGAGAPGIWAAGAAAIWFLGHVRMRERQDDGNGGPAVLEIVGVRKRLGTRIVLESIDLRCDPGEVTLVVGANGAGKSTLLRIAAGIVEPDRGAVRVAGFELSGGNARARAELGYAPDTAEAFPELSVGEFIKLVAALKGAPEPERGLWERLGVLPIREQRMRTLSFGQVKRVYLLAVTIGGPRLWLLDEPSNGLDPAGGDMVTAMLAEHAQRGGAALVATNDARLMALCAGPRVRLREGRLVRE